MDDASYKKFYPDEETVTEFDKLPKTLGTVLKGTVDSINSVANASEKGSQSSEEYKGALAGLKTQCKERLNAQKEFDKLSNLKKDMVRRKIRKLIRRNKNVFPSS